MCVTDDTCPTLILVGLVFLGTLEVPGLLEHQAGHSDLDHLLLLQPIKEKKLNKNSKG